MMTLFEHQQAFLKHVPLLLQKLWDAGFQVTAGEMLRTPEQQQIYLDTGKAKTAKSNHIVKCAIDLNIFPQGSRNFATKAELQAIGDFWESLDPLNRWGGNFKSFTDCPHFERNQFS